MLTHSSNLPFHAASSFFQQNTTLKQTPTNNELIAPEDSPGCLVNVKVYKQAKLLAREYFYTNFTQLGDLPGLIKAPLQLEVRRQRAAHPENHHFPWCSVHIFKTWHLKRPQQIPELCCPVLSFPPRGFVSTQKVSSSRLPPIRPGRAVLRKHERRRLRRQHKLELNYYRNTHSLLFSSWVLPCA